MKTANEVLYRVIIWTGEVDTEKVSEGETYDEAKKTAKRWANSGYTATICNDRTGEGVWCYTAKR